MSWSVTAVIPACNSGKTIECTLRSVLGQSVRPRAVIVVDDASTDDTRERVMAFGDRVTLLTRDRNSGSADIPRYQGVEAAPTEWVALVDADDLWETNKLEQMGLAIEAQPDIPLWHHSVRVIDADGRGERIRHAGAIPGTGQIGPALLERCFICTSAVVVRREAWLNARSLGDLGGYGTGWDFFLAIARNHPVGFVNQVLGSYRYTTTSISRKNWRRYSRDVVGMMRIDRNRLWEGIVSRADMTRILKEAFCEDADLHRDAGQPLHSLWFCAGGLIHRPLDAGLWMRTAKALGRMFVPYRPTAS
ncbi:MAG: glycosyltransferase [Kiritimatiellae bacterium]|nr:glycosyltransferase [Kiritimatiellia bacterium]